ncbi:MAG: hypothetical protein ACXVA2_24995 [Mucilaginibacter sp.]
MHSEAKETARLYALLTDKLGSDTTEAMFNYIDNKTVQSVEATIKTLATKEDLRIAKDDLRKEIGLVKDDLAKFKYDLSKDIGNSVKWMFIFWIGQVGATLAIVLLFLKK